MIRSTVYRRFIEAVGVINDALHRFSGCLGRDHIMTLGARKDFERIIFKLIECNERDHAVFEPGKLVMETMASRTL